MSAEDVAVRRAALFQRILQGSGYVLLADDLGEALRAVLASQDLITHGKTDYTCARYTRAASSIFLRISVAAART